MNNVILAGQVLTSPTYSHSCGEIDFYGFDVGCRRTSNYMDVLRCIAPKHRIEEIKDGDFVKFRGEIRLKNQNDEAGKRHCILSVYVISVEEYEGVDVNEVDITGFICNEPTFNTTATARKISGFTIAVDRLHNKTDYIPCLAWGHNAELIYKAGKGTYMSGRGRWQSRNYEKVNADGVVEVKRAYELSFSSIAILHKGVMNGESKNNDDISRG